MLLELRMKVTIVGSGYVGLVSGACFAQMGNQVTCFDVDYEKISMLKKNKVPIYEKGLQEIIEETSKNNCLRFTDSAEEAYKDPLVIFIAVGTPMGEDGSADLSHVLDVANTIGQYISSYAVIVTKSTVPVGTTQLIKGIIQTRIQKRNLNIDFDVASNPEFLKEGVAIKDFMSPDRIIIGSSSSKAIKILQELYAPFTLKKERLVIMDIKSAEMTKYTANAMLATKISFMNEISRICEAVGADINAVRYGIGSDPRIGYDFIYAGCGYGGSCFPKDIRALQKIAQSQNIQTPILQAVEIINNTQKLILVKKIKEYFGNNLSGKTFALWGLSFKPETDDVREAPSLEIIKEIFQSSGKVQAYDPKAIKNTKKYIQDNSLITYYEDKYLALKNCDALIICTEWKEFRSPDFAQISENLKNKVIFDGRNIYSASKLEAMGFKYFMIGKA